MVANDIKISQKTKNKGYFSIKKYNKIWKNRALSQVKTD